MIVERQLHSSKLTTQTLTWERSVSLSYSNHCYYWMSFNSWTYNTSPNQVVSFKKVFLIHMVVPQPGWPKTSWYFNKMPLSAGREFPTQWGFSLFILAPGEMGLIFFLWTTENFRLLQGSRNLNKTLKNFFQIHKYKDFI